MFKRTVSVLLTVFVVVAGWFTIGYGYGTILGQPISTICFLGGLAVFIVGIVGFIQIAARNKEVYDKTVSLKSELLKLAGIYILGIWLLVSSLSSGWDVFIENITAQNILAVFLTLGIANLVFSIYRLRFSEYSNSSLVSGAINLVCYFSCVFYLLATEDDYIKLIGADAEDIVVMEITNNIVFIGKQKDTTYYKAVNRTIIDKQGLDSIR